MVCDSVWLVVKGALATKDYLSIITFRMAGFVDGRWSYRCQTLCSYVYNMFLNVGLKKKKKKNNSRVERKETHSFAKGTIRQLLFQKYLEYC